MSIVDLLLLVVATYLLARTVPEAIAETYLWWCGDK